MTDKEAADMRQMGEAMRQALDDSVLTHTGRSIGDLASQRVVDDIWPLIAAHVAPLRERAHDLYIALEAVQDAPDLPETWQAVRDATARYEKLLAGEGEAQV